jgi:hypothetical protein
MSALLRGRRNPVASKSGIFCRLFAGYHIQATR